MKYYAFNGKDGMRIFRSLAAAVRNAKMKKHQAMIIYVLEVENVGQMAWRHFVKNGKIAWVYNPESQLEHAERYEQE